MRTGARTITARCAALAVVAALLLAAVGCGGDGSSGTTVGGAGGPHEPDDIGDGCGAAARTPAGDVSADRVVARCGPEAPAPRPLSPRASLRVAVPPHPTEAAAPTLLADRLGEFDAEGLDVRLVDMDTRAGMAALQTGDVDVVVGGIDAPFLDAAHDGSRARLVLGGVLTRSPDDQDTAQPGFWVRSSAIRDDDHDGNEWENLEGQPVAVRGGIGSSAAYPIGLVMEQNDMSLDDVGVAGIGGDEAARKLLDGDVAAAWLDGTSWLPVADDGRYELTATLPASESIDGTIFAERLTGSGADRAVGLAYVRAVIRTINTYLTGDYRSDETVMDALTDALGVSADDLAATPRPLFDWEVRRGTLARIEDALILLGGVAYDMPQETERLVDRTLAREAVGGS